MTTHVHAVCTKCRHEQHAKNWCEKCGHRTTWDSDEDWKVKAIELLREAALESEDGNGEVHNEITAFLAGVTERGTSGGGQR